MLGLGGLGDLGYNDMQYHGLMNIKNKYNIDIVCKAPNSIEQIPKLIAKLVTKYKCDLVIGGCAYLVHNNIEQLADKYPYVNFIMIDEVKVLKPNVSYIVFAQHEGSFVVGTLAAMVTKTKKIGFIGGVDLPIIGAFSKGFKEGINYIDPKIRLYMNFCSEKTNNDFSGFSNTQAGYRKGINMYNSGIDVIYTVSGASGTGVIEAAQEKKKFVIGVDANQDGFAPGYVLTSMIKRLDIAIQDICQKFIKNKLKGATVYEYNYKNNGVSITPMFYTQNKIPANTVERIRRIEQKIKTGEIKVSNLLKFN